MKVNIACLQMASQPYDWDYNIEKATAMITEAAKNGANICLLPEVFIPGYSITDENFKQAEYLNGPTVSTMESLAKHKNIYISGSFIEKTHKEFYNTMFLIGPKGLLGTYRKIYVFSTEQKFWKPGKEITIVDTEFGSVGLGICADMQHAKLWRQYAGKVDLILISSAWPGKPKKTNLSYVKHMDQLCRSLPVQISEALQVPTAYCNACHQTLGELPLGYGTLTCQGFSKIADKGKILASIDSGEEKIIQATIEISEERPTSDLSRFQNWIKFPLREKFLKFAIQKLPLLYAKLYYHWHKKKFLS
ncbi:MAG: carbon-nitrogen hydrolase family protein [Candidatus Helarchaeota archaeon]|nr:carbon-nitrogen hydrolase family protein [Candidatus Helarchaeota archaeon]